MRKKYFVLLIPAALFLLCASTKNIESKWSGTTQVDLQEEGSVTHIAWLPNGNDVIISTENGEISRYDMRNKQRVWTITATNHKQTIYVADINPAGTEMITYANNASTEGEIDLVIRSTDDGSIVKRITEESHYVEKKYPNNDPLDLRRSKDPEDSSWQMMPSYAHYTSDGGFVCAWKNAKDNFAMFDHSLNAYNSSYAKTMEWQHISNNNPGERNGNWAGLPWPVMLDAGSGNYIYGDADCDVYLLDKATIADGKKNFQIQDKNPPPKFFKRPVKDDVGVTALFLKGNNLHCMIAGSGFAYFGIYDVVARKHVLPWVDLGNEDYYMELSNGAKYFAAGRNGFRIYNIGTKAKEFNSEFGGGTCFMFNPTNDNEIIYAASTQLMLLERK